MPILTENDFLLMETASGWAGDDRYTAPPQEALLTLAASIPIPAENQAEFCIAMQLLHRWFCDKALPEAVERHKKSGRCLPYEIGEDQTAYGRVVERG